jgi:hypothetical protein
MKCVRIASLLLLVAGVAGVGACGGAKQDATPAYADPSAAEGPNEEPGSYAGTGEFEREERRLEELFGQEEGDLPPAPADAQPRIDEHGRTTLDAGQRCTIACKALASMKRAAEQVCDLEGDDDERCVDLRARVEKARRRVSGKCPQCAAAQPE